MNTSVEKPNNRWTLIAFFGVFLLPVLAAYLALYTGWWQKQGSTEHGQLLVPPIMWTDLKLQNLSHQPLAPSFLQRRWRLIYIAPDVCAASCENSLFLMHQMQLSLGEEQQRLKLLLIFNTQHLSLAAKIKQQYPLFEQAQSETGILDHTLQRFFAIPNPNKNITDIPQAADHLYIMDPLGEIMLRYPTYADPKQSILEGRGVLKDLQKLLKESHIG